MGGSKKNKKLTIMVVPHDAYTDEVRQFNISTSSIRFTWLFFIVLITLFVIGLAVSVNKTVDYAKLEDLSRENRDLKKDAKTFLSEKKNLEEQLAGFKEEVVSLTTLAGLTEGPMKKVGGGKGGPGKVRYSLPVIPLESIGELNNSLSQMQKEALELEQGLEEIKGILEDDEAKAKLAATPFILPVSGGRVTSGFGYRRCPFTRRREFHEGIDIAVNVGTPIRAPADGKVTYTGWKSGYGRTLKIDHGYGYKTVYGHNSRIKVKKGQEVKRGDIIALVGNTGRSTGPHLHYEIRVNNKAINPFLLVLPKS